VLRALIIAFFASVGLVASAAAQNQSGTPNPNDAIAKVRALSWIKAPASAPIGEVVRTTEVEHVFHAIASSHSTAS
jgi:hypothetical protein